MNKKICKIYVEKKSIFYIWLPEEDELFINLKDKNGIVATLYNSNETAIYKESCNFELKKAKGIYIVEIKNKGKEKNIEIELNKNSYIFFLPGFGLVPSHFEKSDYILRFFEKEMDLWTYIPVNLEKFIIQTTLYKNFEVYLVFPSNKKEKPLWLTHPLSSYNTSIVNNIKKGWYKFEIKTDLIPFRFLIYGGYPLFLEKPPFPFEYKKIYFDIRNEKGEKINSVLRFYSLNHLIKIHNKLITNRKPVCLPPIKISVFVNSGFKYKEANFNIIKNKEKKILKEFLSTLSGWVCGDLHIHSCINSDGADTPEIICETSICNGLNFIFISDNPSLVERCKKYNKKGEFFVLPGQEVSSSFFHINALNIKEDLQKYIDEKNIQRTIERLIEKMKKYEKNGKEVCLMLNHPSHLPEISKKHGYFCSWWIVDKFEEIKIVENFDFKTWFKKLNEGKKIVGLWTTDTHDVSLIPPGLKRSYVYVGKKFNIKNLIDGIKRGNVFCTRYPGAMIDFRINGKIPGEIVFIKKSDFLKLYLYCESKRPIKYIEIIGDGKVIHIVNGRKSFIINETILLKPEYKWIISRVYLYEEEWRKDSHSLEPLVLSGCVAFTNPIWIERLKQ
ncbi:MAG: CehA/McbA family metallohydrolase [Candidatus Omnitrophica bacterium]|nr:CehA/McbA family metallohydrolase [Candidatus Omnitrophota bacterium]